MPIVVLERFLAVRQASASLRTNEYFTYTGVDPITGAPIGLTSIAVDPASPYICSGSVVSANRECGNAPEPRTLAAIDLKSHYQDEYIFGLEQALGLRTGWGAKLTYRDLKSAIDDTCLNLLADFSDIGCFMFNPGRANSFWKDLGDGVFERVDFSAQELGLGKLKRRYYALDLYWEQRADSWYVKTEYTLSRNYGNTEGQLNSDAATTGGGQTDVSATVDWDLPQLMEGANGILPNHRAHVIKLFGYVQLNPQWRSGASLTVASGRPRNCTSMYPTPDPGLYNSARYWFCGLPGSNAGTNPDIPNYVPPSGDYGPSPRGSHGTTPWTYSLNLNLSWTPKRTKYLNLRADVINVLGRQTPGYYYPRYSATPHRGAASYDPLYGLPSSFMTPRYVSLSMRYDF